MIIRFNVVIQDCQGEELQAGMDELALWMAERGVHNAEDVLVAAAREAIRRARHRNCTPDYCRCDPAWS